MTQCHLMLRGWSPGQFEVVRRSVNKTDKHDARAIAFFLSKGMLPEAKQTMQAVSFSSSNKRPVTGIFNQ